MADVKFCEYKDVQDVLASFKEESTSWDRQVVDPKIDRASDDFHAVLATHFEMPTTTENTPSRMKNWCALQAAVYCIDWRYAVADENVPDFVERYQDKIDKMLERVKLAHGPKKVDWGLTPLGEASGDSALAQGVMDNKRAQTDRSRPENWWEPADDGSSDSDGSLGDQSVNT